MTVLGLQGRVAFVIQWEPNHKNLNSAIFTELPQLPDVVVEVATFQRSEGCDRKAKAIATCQSDSSPAHIKAESRAWSWF